MTAQRLHTFVCFSIVSVSMLCSSAPAALTTDLSTQRIDPNRSGQAIDIFIRSSDAATDPTDITGINLNLFLGDGFGPLAEPIFVDDVVFSDGPGGRDYVWDAFAGTTTQPDGAPPQYALASFTFNASGQSIRPDGLLATVFVDTTGFAGDDFNFILSGDPTLPLGPTEFIRVGGVDSIVPEFPSTAESSITVAAVPEPSAVAVSAAIAAGVIARRRKRAVVT